MWKQTSVYLLKPAAEAALHNNLNKLQIDSWEVKINKDEDQ